MLELLSQLRPLPNVANPQPVRVGGRSTGSAVDQEPVGLRVRRDRRSAPTRP